MQYKKNSLYIGGGLILFGFFNLLSNMDVIYFEAEYVVSLVFLGIGAFLFMRFRQDQQMIVLIFAAISTFIGLAILLSTNRLIDDNWTGVLFLWGTSLLFSYGYLRNTKNWGFVIPAGVLFTIGLMVLVEMLPRHYDDLLGGLFFLGIGLTFGFLYVIRSETNKLDWAKFPAIILILFSGFLFLVTSDSHLANLILPLGLISLGSYLIYNSMQNKSVKRV